MTNLDLALLLQAGLVVIMSVGCGVTFIAFFRTIWRQKKWL